MHSYMYMYITLHYSLCSGVNVCQAYRSTVCSGQYSCWLTLTDTDWHWLRDEGETHPWTCVPVQMVDKLGAVGMQKGPERECVLTDPHCISLLHGVRHQCAKQTGVAVVAQLYLRQWRQCVTCTRTGHFWMQGKGNVIIHNNMTHTKCQLHMYVHVCTCTLMAAVKNG